MAIALSGELSFTPLADVLEQLRQRKAVGTLSVSIGALTKSVYFKSGQIIFATSTDVHDRLGEILVKTGTLKRDNLDYALKLSQKSGGMKKLGAVLVENGLVAPKDLFNGLKAQVKDIIFSLFLLSEGKYQFEERLPSDLIQLHINYQDLISEIIQRIKQES